MRGSREIRERDTQGEEESEVWLERFCFIWQSMKALFLGMRAKEEIAGYFLCLSELAGFYPNIWLPSLYWQNKKIET